jgi:OTU domain-containing protein 3
MLRECCRRTVISYVTETSPSYHDWEHFSSVRNTKGPHHGLPKIVETPVEVLPPRNGSVGPSKHQLKQMRGKPRSTIKAPPTSKYLKDEHLTLPVPKIDPTQIVLPLSRATSPADSASEPSSQLSSEPSSLAPVTPPDTLTFLRTNRSPKRSFGESECEDVRATPDGSVDGRRVRRKTESPSPAPPTAPESPGPIDLKGILEFDSDSSLSPPPPDPEEIAREAAKKKALTRRERKRLGLPKDRKSGVKIVIPGGRHPARLQVRQAAERQPLSRQTSLGVGDGETKEWEKNGSGRFDARGFKELRI